MKRRTNPAHSRLPRPAPVRSALHSYFPGIDKLSDSRAFRLIYQVVCLAPPSDRDLSHRLLATFLEIRGLTIRVPGTLYEGCPVWEVYKGDKMLFSVSGIAA